LTGKHASTKQIVNAERPYGQKSQCVKRAKSLLALEVNEPKAFCEFWGNA